MHQHLPKEMPFHKNDIAEDAAAGILFNILMNQIFSDHIFFLKVLDQFLKFRVSCLVNIENKNWNMHYALQHCME